MLQSWSYTAFGVIAMADPAGHTFEIEGFAAFGESRGMVLGQGSIADKQANQNQESGSHGNAFAGIVEFRK
jgi:hypothetical protein